MTRSSWQDAGKWYDEIVGKEGHYYHQTLIIPQTLKLLNFSTSSSLLDLACGQGVLSRHIPSAVSYLGIDASSHLITSAKRLNRNPLHRFLQADVTQKLNIPDQTFSHATLILALQNIESPFLVFKNASQALQPDGTFLMIINHPCFRIPRQSSWRVDSENKIQYRRIDRYMSPMKIPIQTHPSQGQASTQTWSFHYSLRDYSHWLKEAGFMIELIDEWCSNKISQGGAAKMENRGRSEIPLFMAILARKRH
jgi:ubiquinone/menaquinone biosynthesis C-methylase UbiE